MIAWAIQGHPRSKYRHFKRVLSYEEGAQIPSRILKIGQYEIQKTIPLRYMGLEGRQITGFQLKIRNPWRYKVWPNPWKENVSGSGKKNSTTPTDPCCTPQKNSTFSG